MLKQQFNALHRKEDYTVIKCDWFLTLSQSNYKVEFNSLMNFIFYVVNRISAYETHALNIDNDSIILKNQLMTACCFQLYSFSLQ